MAEKQTIEFVETALRAHNIPDLLAFSNGKEPQNFPLICLEIIDHMINALMEDVEVELPEGTLKAIQHDLLTLTRSIVKLRRTLFGSIYALSELEPLIDKARGKISGAINEHQKKKLNTDPPVYALVDVLVEYIHQCRYTLEEAYQKLEEFSAQENQHH